MCLVLGSHRCACFAPRGRARVGGVRTGTGRGHTAEHSSRCGKTRKTLGKGNVSTALPEFTLHPHCSVDLRSRHVFIASIIAKPPRSTSGVGVGGERRGWTSGVDVGGRCRGSTSRIDAGGSMSRVDVEDRRRGSMSRVDVKDRRWASMSRVDVED